MRLEAGPLEDALVVFYKDVPINIATPIVGQKLHSCISDIHHVYVACSPDCSKATTVQSTASPL